MVLHIFRKKRILLQCHFQWRCLVCPSTTTYKHPIPTHQTVAVLLHAYVHDHYWYVAIPLQYKFHLYRLHRYLVSSSRTQGLPSRGELRYVRGQLIFTIPPLQQQRYYHDTPPVHQYRPYLDPKIRSQKQVKHVEYF